MNQLALNLDQPRSDGDCRTADDGFTLAYSGHDKGAALAALWAGRVEVEGV
jgi:hypothetical protein